MSKQVRADGILLLVTLCWGVSYLLMDISLTDLDPFTLNSFRFLGAFAIAAAVSWKRVKTVNRQTLKYSLIVGIALVVVYIGATFGVKYTSISNSGFLCALTVVFTPFFAWLLFKKKPDKKRHRTCCAHHGRVSPPRPVRSDGSRCRSVRDVSAQNPSEGFRLPN